ncbi:MAG: GGDEF domain-containing protein, partial [Clostridia bacterium]
MNNSGFKINEFYENFYNNFPYGFVVFSCEDDAKLLFANGNAAKVFGVEEKRLSNYYGKDLEELFPKEAEQLSQNIIRCKTLSEPYLFNISVTTSKNNIIFLSCTLQKSTFNKQSRIICYFSDISSEMHINEIKNNNRYTTLLLNLYDQIVTLDIINDDYCVLYTKTQPNILNYHGKNINNLLTEIISKVIYSEDIALYSTFCNLDDIKSSSIIGLSPKTICCRVYESGEYRWNNITLICLEIGTALLCFKNVDNEKRAELLSIENAHLQQQNKTYLLEVKQTELYKMLLEDSKMIIFDYDIEKNSFAVYRKTETGERYCRTLENYMTDGVPNGNTLCPSCYSLFQEKMKQALSTPIKDRFEILLNLYGDSFVWCRVHYKSIQDDSTGKIFRIVGRLYDIDKDVKTKEQLSIKSNTDSLSGLLNRLTFENIVNDKTKDSDARYAFCLIDIDNFKQINDSFGHPVGDKVIVELSKML